MGAVEKYTYDRHDVVTSVTDALGNVTLYTVDANGQVTKRDSRTAKAISIPMMLYNGLRVSRHLWAMRLPLPTVTAMIFS